MTVITCAEALMQVLISEGVEYVFGLPGSTETQFMDALEDHPQIRYILGLHECIASGIAIGYARASGKVGVLNFHTYPGIGAAMGVLLCAYRGGVPLLVTAGNPDRYSSIREGGLTADLVALGKNFSKWSAEVTFAHDLALIMRRAFKVVRQPPTGPVFVSLPQNIMNETIDFEYTTNSPLSFSRRRPDDESVDNIANLLVKAQKPVVILGTGMNKHQAMAEVVELVELIGAYAYVFPMGSDTVFPTTHPQFLGVLDTSTVDARRFFESVDVTIAIGTQPPPSVKNVIQIDNDLWELGKNWPIAAGIEGDIKLSVTDLNNSLRRKLSPEDHQAARNRAENISKEKKALSKRWLTEAEEQSNSLPISAHRLARELADVLQLQRAVIVDESWSYSTIIQRYIGFTEPNSYMRGQGSSIGQGMPIALGVKLAMPGHQVIALVGDGSAIWSCQSLWTAAHYNIPVKFIILHNASYRIVKLNKIRQMGDRVKGRFLGLNLDAPRVDFCKLARAMGIPGQRVDRPDDLNSVMKSALESDKPQLVEVTIESRV